MRPFAAASHTPLFFFVHMLARPTIEGRFNRGMPLGVHSSTCSEA